MTAITVMTDNRYAYLACDGAAYDCTTGTVAGLFGKAVILFTARLVIAATGGVSVSDLLEEMDLVHDLSEPTQDSLLAAVPEALRRIQARLDHDATAMGLGLANVAVFAAAYDMALDRPRVLTIQSERSPCLPGQAPYVWIEHPSFTMPALTEAQGLRIFPRRYTVRPRAELRSVLETQRRQVLANVAGGCGVGGLCHFFRVGRDGVHFDELIRFPEVVGDRLDPSLPGEPVASAADAWNAV